MINEKPKILVRAPVLTRTGYGEHGRFVLRALRTIEEKIDIYVSPVNWGNSNWIWENNEERQWLDKLIHKTAVYQQKCKEMKHETPYAMSVQVTIPNEWERLAPVNIGVTAGIETTKVAPIWLEKANNMNKVVTISQHSRETFINSVYEGINQQTGQPARLACNQDIAVVHYPAKTYKKRDLKLKLETPFNFLTVAQWGPRKNLPNTIQWFVEEFIDNPEVGLVVKTFAKGGSVLDRHATSNMLKTLLSKYKNRKCKVYLLHGDLNDEEMHSLYQQPSIKAFVSLSHGEGFGLPHFEAAYTGLPVVAPAWSGYMDFLCIPREDKSGRIKTKPSFAAVDYDLKPVQKEAHWDGVIQADSEWCFANQGSYKMKLREVYKDYGRFKKQATELKKWVRNTFTEERQHQQLASIVSDHGLMINLYSQMQSDFAGELLSDAQVKLTDLSK